MKTIYIGKSFEGYGHNKVTIRYRNGKEYSTITSDTQATDYAQSDDEKIRKEGERTIIHIVKRAHNLK